MTTSLSRPQSTAVATSTVAGLSAEQWGILKASVCKGFSDQEAQVFAFRCQAMGLSPLSGQITAFKQGGGVIPIVTIDGYRAIAARIDPNYVVEIEFLSGNDWVDWIPDEAASQCRAKVYRSGSERPVVKAVSRKEFSGSGNPWRTMPNHMLAKVAESHALRMAYPQSLAGTYSTDEMPAGKTVQAQVTDITPPEPATPIAPPAIGASAPIAPATVSEAQLKKLGNAMQKVFTDIGREAFVVNIKAGFGIETLSQLPAEQFDVVMRSVSDAKRVDLWNMAMDSQGNLLLSEERIAELQALISATTVADTAP